MDRISLLLGFKTLYVVPRWSWYHKLPIKNFKKKNLKEEKGHKGAPGSRRARHPSKNASQKHYATFPCVSRDICSVTPAIDRILQGPAMYAWYSSCSY
jgi:hypothetical protein